MSNMEINYNLIIKHLCNKPKQVNAFITKKNIYMYSKSFPEVFQNYVIDKMFRFGITVYDNENNNISFWSSLLTLLDEKFIVPYDNDEWQTILLFKSQLLEIYPKHYSVDKDDIKARIKLEADATIVQYVCDVMDINMIIYNFKDNNMLTLYKGSEMNLWKPTFLFAKCGEYWEPIMIETSNENNKRNISYNDAILKKIAISNSLLSTYDNIKEYKYNDNISNILDKEKKKLCSNIFIKVEEIEDEYSLVKLNKLTKDKLFDICSKLEITVKSKKTVKQDIIDLIIAKKKS